MKPAQVQWFLVAIGCLIVGFVMALFNGCPNAPPSLQIGQQARLHRTDGGDDPPAFLVAADAKALSQCISAVNAGDPYGNKQLMAAGRLWLVPAGTSVVVLELAFFSRKVRILEGEHQGKAGWIPMEFVAP
jgi:hypothetical protein